MKSGCEPKRCRALEENDVSYWKISDETKTGKRSFSGMFVSENSPATERYCRMNTMTWLKGITVPSKLFVYDVFSTIPAWRYGNSWQPRQRILRLDFRRIGNYCIHPIFPRKRASFKPNLSNIYRTTWRRFAFLLMCLMSFFKNIINHRVECQKFARRSLDWKLFKWITNCINLFLAIVEQRLFCNTWISLNTSDQEFWGQENSQAGQKIETSIHLCYLAQVIRHLLH